MPGTNGTDEGVLRDWLDREMCHWDQAFNTTIDDAVTLLETACFVDHSHDLIERGMSELDVASETIELYEDGMSDILHFIRASGALPNDIAWSKTKIKLRRAAAADAVTDAVRQALEDGLYRAEVLPIGDHELYRSWIRALMLFIYDHAANGPEYPGLRADEAQKFTWAYEALRDVEEHTAFHVAVSNYLNDPGVYPVAEAIIARPPYEIVDFEMKLLAMNRFDLILNSGLRWLVGAVERD